MAELIRVNENDFGEKKIQTVDARDLHEKLEIGRDFTTWIKERISKYDFVEGIDYLMSIPQNGGKPQGGRPQTEYFITLSTAKELCMVENNEKGKEIRKYFIRVEEEYKKRNSLLMTPEEMILKSISYLTSIVETQKQQIKELEPKAMIYDETMETINLLTVKEVAKIAKVGSNIFFEWLRKNKIVYKENGHNLPYERYINQKWFEVKWKTMTIQEQEFNYPQTYITTKGAAKLIEMYKNQQGLRLYEGVL